MKKLYLLIILFVFLSSMMAQTIYFCQSVTENGKPVNTANTWKIKSTGGYLSILLENNSKLPKGLYYFIIDKKEGKEYEAFDSKSVRINEEKNWVNLNYIFKESGEYEVYVLGPNQQKYGEGHVNIKIDDNKSITEKPEKLYDYTGLNILFCELVIAEKPVNPKSKISLGSRNGTIYIYIRNNSPLNTSKIFVDIKMKDESGAYTIDADYKKYGISPEWHYAFFKYKFSQPGDYKFTVMDENNHSLGARIIVVTK